MDKMSDAALLVGRILLALMFVTAGWGKIGGYAGTQGYMEAMGVPGFMLPLVILLELGGGLAIMPKAMLESMPGYTSVTAWPMHGAFSVLPTWLIWRSDTASRALDAFVALLQERAPIAAAA